MSDPRKDRKATARRFVEADILDAIQLMRDIEKLLPEAEYENDSALRTQIRTTREHLHFLLTYAQNGTK